MLPYYLSIGVSRDEIDDSTPKDLEPYENARKYKTIQQDQLNWYSGIYTMSAVMTALDKAFAGNQSKMEYVEQPLLADINLTEEEKLDRDIKKALAIEAKWARQTALHLPETLEDET